MILIVVLMLVGSLLALLIFIVSRVRRGNKTSFQHLQGADADRPAGSVSKLIIKRGETIIIKTTGIPDERPFFHNN